MDVQTEKGNYAAYRLAKVSLILGIISIFNPAAFLLLNVLEDVFQLDLSSLPDDFLFGGGIASGLLGLPAIIIGIMALRKMTEKKKGKSFAITSIVFGIVGILFLCHFSQS